MAYKKLSKLYPEYKRVRRRKAKSSKPKVKEIPERKLSPAKMAETKQWARKNMDKYFGSYRNLTQDWIVVEKDSEEPKDKDS